ncbi:hypothetical protein COU17_02530 [Candidatus Kaiserbacteria bacterium CG10_big_fil_rev_8_21_14_0_10_49_17]|uniref:Uncharacterized protein n=1 Tax=Candidatus Kaiserbacteria bacterium CG10_big_fil_rev_8_21_14_0_10_49_17 TaxID=1974609 RepID=A0A2M6WDZ9_9BACT|nr:MAG: hypothetical protein COU17_02530 [Candidatus Kaiserbacteria bacterium CG10_big_fil_rev_8_21_14_0_10_49_17]
MTDENKEPLPPTVARVLDEYLIILHADNTIDNEVADRLDALLRNGKVPKPEEIDAVLFAPTKNQGP